VKLMTGISNKRNYIRFGLLDRGQRTFAHILQDAGYKTCIAGKWQLGREPDAPQHFGFQQALLWQHMRGRTDEQQHDTRYPNPRLELNGQPVDYSDGQYSSDLFVDFIANFMEENRKEPFFVYYPMALVHCPFSPTPSSDDWDPQSRGSKTYKGDPQYFADMVAFTDHCVARIDAKLQELGLRNNTLLIFTGDNGTDTPIVTRTTYGEVIGAKGSMTDGGNRVPCIIQWPIKIAPGSVNRNIIDFSDFLPTFCQAAGVPVPPHIDGQSFLWQLTGQSGKPRDSIYMWYSRNGQADKAKAFARNQRYKLYETGKFYDVQSDRLEKNPLDEAKVSDEARAVRHLLQTHIDRFGPVTRPGDAP
jgi:arylsulfatase A